jgi:hypothetical protein
MVKQTVRLMKLRPAKCLSALMATLILAPFPRGDTVPNRLSATATDLTEATVNCPERVWPEHSWRNFQVLLIDNQEKTALLWNDQAEPRSATPKLTPIPYDSLGGMAQARFGNATLNNAPVMWWMLRPNTEQWDEDAQIMHEGFHSSSRSFLSPQPFYRGLSYPEDWKPRFYRQEIIASLRTAVESHKRKLLGQATYWHDKWIAEFPADSKQLREVDREEGAAEYFGTMSASLAAVGCQGNNDALFNVAAKKWLTWKNNLFAKEGESYVIGGLSGLLLQERNPNKWQQELIKGGDLEELLLANSRPVVEAPSPKIEHSLRDLYVQENAQMEAVIKPIIEHMASHDYILVVIPESWEQGSFTTSGRVTFSQGEQLNQLVLRRVSSFKSVSPFQFVPAQTTGQFRGENTLVVGDATCGSKGIGVLLARTELDEQVDGTYSIQKDTFQATGMRLDMKEFDRGVALACAR